eukprot:5818966-Prymnesium_polylepis.1
MDRIFGPQLRPTRESDRTPSGRKPLPDADRTTRGTGKRNNGLARAWARPRVTLPGPRVVYFGHSRYVATVADARVAAAVAKPPDGRG